jgi:hypothetical protein
MPGVRAYFISPAVALPRTAKLVLMPAMIGLILLLLLALDSAPHVPYVYIQF